MKLTFLRIAETPISNISSIEDMPLEQLDCKNTMVNDLSPLKTMPLKHIKCDFKSQNDVDLVYSLKGLETINDKPVAAFWAEPSIQWKPFQKWISDIGQLPAIQQVKAVTAKLAELNPEFDGNVESKVENDVVTRLKIVTDNVADISPVRALRGLKQLQCSANPVAVHGRLSNLGPLKGMNLTRLYCSGNPMLTDLSPLHGMQLEILRFDESAVSDIAPIVGMPLVELNCRYTHVSDLSHLKEMKLSRLSCGHTKVSDLSPLRGMELKYLEIDGLNDVDLSPIADCPLSDLLCGDNNAADLTALKGMKLSRLSIDYTPISDLSPLKGMPLTQLNFDNTKVSDVSVLQGMELKTLTFTPGSITNGIETLRQMKTVERIGTSENNSSTFPPEEFWKKYDAGEFKKP